MKENSFLLVPALFRAHSSCNIAFQVHSFEIKETDQRIQAERNTRTDTNKQWKITVFDASSVVICKGIPDSKMILM